MIPACSTAYSGLSCRAVGPASSVGSFRRSSRGDDRSRTMQSGWVGIGDASKSASASLGRMHFCSGSFFYSNLNKDFNLSILSFCKMIE